MVGRRSILGWRHVRDEVIRDPTLTVGARIAAIRVAKRLTQQQLAVVIGCRASTLSGWEQGRGEPWPSYLYRLAQVFECSMDALYAADAPWAPPAIPPHETDAAPCRGINVRERDRGTRASAGPASRPASAPGTARPPWRLPHDRPARHPALQVLPETDRARGHPVDEPGADLFLLSRLRHCPPQAAHPGAGTVTAWQDDPLIAELWADAPRPRRVAPVLSADGAKCVYHGRWLSKAEGEAGACDWCERERGEG